MKFKNLLIRGALGMLVMAGGMALPLQAQETEEEGERERLGRGDWRDLSEEERRERVERFRNMSSEERRERWRERRERRDRGGEETEELAEERTGLEFRSILTLDGETQFSVRDNDAGRTVWLSVGETSAGIHAVAFDEAAGVLTVEHEEETRELSLAQSRIAEMDESAGERQSRRELRQERREQFRAFRDRWSEAAEDSPQLQEIESHFREAGREMWQIRRAMRDAERGSPERRTLRREARDLREELSLLSEYAALEIQQHPGFEPEDAEMAERFARRLAWQRRGGERR